MPLLRRTAIPDPALSRKRLRGPWNLRRPKGHSSPTNRSRRQIKPKPFGLSWRRISVRMATFATPTAMMPAHLAFGDAARAHRLDRVVDRARRDALHVGLLDHRGERLLGHASRLQEAGEVGALPQLGMCSSTVPARVSQSCRDSRCAGQAAAGSSRHGPRRWRRPLPSPSAARRQSRSCRAGYRGRGSSLRARRFIMSLVIGASFESGCVSNPTLPTNIDDRRYATRSLPRC